MATHKEHSALHLEPVACDSEMKAQAKRAYPHDEKRELAFIDGWLSRDATQQQNFVAIDWGAVHNKLMDVWYRELSADEGLDEIQGLINTTPPQCKPLATDEQKDAARWRWLRDNNASFAWIPSRYNEKTISGFSAFGTGYLGFEFEAAVDLAIGAAHSIK